MATTIPQADLKLYELLQAACPPNVQTCFGPPRFEDPLVVAIFTPKSSEADFAQLGRDHPAEQENFDIPVEIKYLDRGAQYEDIPALHVAAMGLYSVLHGVVYANRTLDGTLTDGWAIARIEGGTGPVPALVGDAGTEPGEQGQAETQGYVELISAAVRCTARI